MVTGIPEYRPHNKMAQAPRALPRIPFKSQPSSQKAPFFPENSVKLFRDAVAERVPGALALQSMFLGPVRDPSLIPPDSRLLCIWKNPLLWSTLKTFWPS